MSLKDTLTGDDHIRKIPMYNDSLEFRKESKATISSENAKESWVFSVDGELRVYHENNGKFNICIYKQIDGVNHHASIGITSNDLMQMLHLVMKKDDEIRKSLHERLMQELVVKH